MRKWQFCSTVMGKIDSGRKSDFFSFFHHKIANGIFFLFPTVKLTSSEKETFFVRQNCKISCFIPNGKIGVKWKRDIFSFCNGKIAKWKKTISCLFPHGEIGDEWKRDNFLSAGTNWVSSFLLSSPSAPGLVSSTIHTKIPNTKIPKF